MKGKNKGTILVGESYPATKDTLRNILEFRYSGYDVEFFDDRVSLEDNLKTLDKKVKAVILDPEILGKDNEEVVGMYGEKFPIIIYSRDCISVKGAFAHMPKLHTPLETVVDTIRKALVH